MRTISKLWALTTLLCACEADPGPTPAASTAVETLAEFGGAPKDARSGVFACLGKAAGTAPGGSLELTGYVRTLADPEAKSAPPAASVEIFSADGTSLGKGFADATKAGRVSVSVPVKSTGFDGYALVTSAGFLDWQLQSSRKTVSTSTSGWAWMTKQDEVAQRAQKLGLPLQDGKALLVGAVHDCDGFGAANVVVVVGGSPDAAVFYLEGFDLVGTRTFTSDAGRFAVANLPPGKTTIKAYGRSKAGGKLELVSTMQATLVAGKVTAVELAPRAAGQ